ncbi:hypothetical protein [Mesorhizobium carmichaelinearum]|uniref:hypothetical protein n=1 Tax=Mesorhizobium carmichaelinearum TaxID=1208188 RepID=UPI000BA3C1B9|nr:hypothetical protein [Mesorhizobium carmichaelinearum]
MNPAIICGGARQTLIPVADVDPKLGQQVKVHYDLPQTSLPLAFLGVVCVFLSDREHGFHRIVSNDFR